MASYLQLDVTIFDFEMISFVGFGIRYLSSLLPYSSKYLAVVLAFWELKGGLYSYFSNVIVLLVDTITSSFGCSDNLLWAFYGS